MKIFIPINPIPEATMKRCLSILTFLSLTIVISGCGSQLVQTSAATFVPDDRILDRQNLNQSPGTGEVIIKRDAGYTGVTPCTARLFVDGSHVAQVNPGEKIVLHLYEGDHILSASVNVICGNTMKELAINVKQDRQYTVRMGYDWATGFFLSPTAF